MQALGGAAEILRAALVSAGWKALPNAGEWYARRFAWEPAGAEPDDAPAAHQPGSSRFPRPDWSQATDALWHCEIEWDPESATARFRAAVCPPGVRCGSPAGATASESRRSGRPDPEDLERRAQLRSLAATLEAGGWERAGHGSPWFAERFVWRRDGAPPDRLDTVPNEGHLG
ncbi:MAG: hypothetical protein ABJC36_10595 [Gemmatimonadales bacterium]